MNQLKVTQTRKQIQDSTSIASGILQRKCDKCHEKKSFLQRAAIRDAPDTAPPIVHEVLRSSGHQLYRDTREFMKLRLGHDFSRIRIHTDSRAAESARAVNALAYTVGHDVVFGRGQYSPWTEEGRRLIAHEMAHVVQQSGSFGSADISGDLEIGELDDPLEESAEQISKQLTSSDKHKMESRSSPRFRMQRKTICDDENDPNTCRWVDDEPNEPSTLSSEAGNIPEAGTPDTSIPEGGLPGGIPEEADIPSSANEQVDQVPQPRSLNQSLDPTLLSTAELEVEIDTIRRWLSAYPGAEQEQLQAAQSSLENELDTRKGSSENVDEKADQVSQPRSLNQSLDPTLLSTAELEVEIDAIRNWLIAYPGPGEEQEQLQAAQSLLQIELDARRGQVCDSDPGIGAVSLCNRDFQGKVPEYLPSWARHCFVWYHPADTTPSTINPEKTSTYDNKTSGTPDAEPQKKGTVCLATYDVDPRCVKQKYQELCSPGNYDLYRFNCCTCANKALIACGAKTESADFPQENQGVGLPDSYGTGWKKKALKVIKQQTTGSDIEGSGYDDIQE